MFKNIFTIFFFFLLSIQVYGIDYYYAGSWFPNNPGTTILKNDTWTIQSDFNIDGLIKNYGKLIIAEGTTLISNHGHLDNFGELVVSSSLKIDGGWENHPESKHVLNGLLSGKGTITGIPLFLGGSISGNLYFDTDLHIGSTAEILLDIDPFKGTYHQINCSGILSLSNPSVTIHYLNNSIQYKHYSLFTFSQLNGDFKLINKNKLGGYMAEIQKENGSIDLVLMQLFPVNLVAFNVYAEQNGAHLNWETAEEFNHLGFEIQKSTDGFKFDSIAWVDQFQREDLNNKFYFYLDCCLLNNTKYYYRLKQVDINGDFAFSHIESISFIHKNITVYPNPVIQNLSISSETDVQGFYIFDQQGRTVKFGSAFNITNINLEDLFPGMYVIQITDVDGTVFRQKLLKL